MIPSNSATPMDATSSSKLTCVRAASRVIVGRLGYNGGPFRWIEPPGSRLMTSFLARAGLLTTCLLLGSWNDTTAQTPETPGPMRATPDMLVSLGRSRRRASRRMGSRRSFTTACRGKGNRRASSPGSASPNCRPARRPRGSSWSTAAAGRRSNRGCGSGWGEGTPRSRWTPAGPCRREHTASGNATTREDRRATTSPRRWSPSPTSGLTTRSPTSSWPTRCCDPARSRRRPDRRHRDLVGRIPHLYRLGPRRSLRVRRAGLRLRVPRRQLGVDARIGEAGERGQRWLALWDPSHYLPLGKAPKLWVTGTNDFAYPLDSLGSRTARQEARRPFASASACRMVTAPPASTPRKSTPSPTRSSREASRSPRFRRSSATARRSAPRSPARTRRQRPTALHQGQRSLARSALGNRRGARSTRPPRSSKPRSRPVSRPIT